MGDSASEPELIDAGAEEEIRNALSLTKESRAWRIFKKLLMAALGSIPWVGGFITAAASIREDETKPRAASRRSGSRVMKSAFDDEEPYVLTELGREFVHYTMNEIVPRLDGGSPRPESPAGENA